MGEPWTVEFYQEVRGSAPVTEFLDSIQNRKLRAKVFRTIDLLEEFGTDLGMPHARPVVGYDFWELRVQFGGDIVRILYAAMAGRRMVLLHGFVKKTPKAPRGDLDIAQRRLQKLLTEG